MGVLSISSGGDARMLKTLLVFGLTLTVTLAADLPFKRIDEITELTGKWNQEEAVYKVTSPRNDVKVSVDGWQMPPFMGLTSWAAFTPGKQQEAMVMGDLVVLQDEVNPVMSAAFGNGLDVTALHNHFFFDEPKVYFMHIAGEGSAEKLATGVKAALDTVKRIRSEKPEPSRSFGGMPPSSNSISPDAIAAALGVKGEAKDGMFKVVIGRTTTMDCGCKVGKEMGVNTWAAFAGTDDNAIVDGDFAVLETELQSVLRSLRNDDINIVAIHHHMSKEEPRILFLHYWGRGPAKNLAESVKRALQVQKGVAFNVSPGDFERARKEGATVVDVCTPKEFAEGHIPGAINLDVNAEDFAGKADDLDKLKPILVNCHAGIRGARAAAILHELGFKSVMNLEGGQIAWKAEGRTPQVGSKVQQTTSKGEFAIQ
jgi:rhodanese-related sulfurtransferase